MKKRICSILLCMILCLALLPQAALAVDGDEYVFYRQLSSAAQAAYDKMDSAESIAKIRSGQGVSYSFSGKYSSQADMEQQVQAYLNTLTQAFAAFEREHPEIFWINGCSQNATYSYLNGHFDCTVTMTPKVAYNWSAGGRSIAEDEALLKSAVQQLAADASVQGGPCEAVL